MVFFIFLFGGIVSGYEAPGYGTRYFTPAEYVVTPHIKWLKPSFQPPLKVLFLAYRFYGGMREIVEVSQRMDIKYDVFASDTVANYLMPHYGTPQGITTELYDRIFKEKISGNYDLIVSGISWKMLPLWARYEILKKVKEGTNFLIYLISPQDKDEYLTRATSKPIQINTRFVFPYKALPEFEKYSSFNEFLTKSVSGYSFGKGKIFIINTYARGPGSMQLLTPVRTKSPLDADYIEYDYYLAFIIKCMLLASGKESDCKLIGPDYVKFDYGKPISLNLSVESQKDRSIGCTFVVRKKSGDEVLTGEKAVRTDVGKSDFVINLGDIPAGSYYVDVWLRERGKVIDFGSSYLEVVSPQGIERIDISKSYRKQDNINGKIVLNQEPEPGLMLKIQHRDNFGRILQQKTIPVSSKETSFNLPPAGYLTAINHIKMQLLKDGKIITEKEQKFSISDIEPKNDFRTIMWCAPVDPMYPPLHLYNFYQRSGIDTIYPQYSDVIPLANLNFVGICESAARFFSDNKSPRDPSDHIRVPCLSDPETLKKIADGLNKDIDRMKDFSVCEFTMGDELFFSSTGHELCFSPYCIKRFQEFIQQEYKTIQNLNKEYNSNYSSFSDVKPVTYQDAMKNPDLIPLWVDYRRCMESVWADSYKYAADVIRKKIPHARVGYEGTDAELNTFKATDFYKIMNAININGCYTRPFIDYAIKDFAQPNSLLSFGWAGGYDFCRDSKIFNYYFEWKNLFKGATCAFLWTGFPGQIMSTTASDFSFFDFFQILLDQLNEIKTGTGKLFMESKREDDQTAILYSASSTHMATLSPQYPSMQEVLNSVVTLMDDVNRQFRVISYKQLEDGVLRKGNLRFLYLPFIQALSQKEATEIINFVKNGGTVIADLRPGVCDEHGRSYEKGILDELFGISQDTKIRTAAKKANITIEDKNFPAKIPPAIVDTTLQVTTGMAKGDAEGIPVFIVNSYGKGKAILLNFTTREYASVKGSLEKGKLEKDKESESLKNFFDTLWTYAGNEKKIRVNPEIPGLLMYRYRTGNNLFLGIIQEVDDSMAEKQFDAELVLHDSYNVYDVREGKYLGYTNRIKTAFIPIKPKVFSLLPYKVTGINLNVPDSVSQGEKLSYGAELIATSGPGFHVFHISLVSPLGDEIPYYTKNISTSDGKIQDSIQLALNEPVGLWKIKIKDVATGINAEKTFNVK
ncbi:MAG: beta-galactosidase [bacterium]|nr:beta-galactosidase [bacterium]